MPKECHPTPSRTAYTHRQQAICSWCLYLHKEPNCKQLGTGLWKTSGSEQLRTLHFSGKKNTAVDQDGDRDGQPSEKQSKEGPRFVKQILLNNPKGTRGTTLSTSQPSSSTPGSRQGLLGSCTFLQASGAAHSLLGCTVGLQCKRGADSSNLFTPVMEH